VAQPQRGQLRQPAAADLTIWQCIMPTLSQRLGYFPSESRAAILPRCRNDYPLPIPINIDGFHGLREEKIGSKISQKISFSPVFLPANVLSSLSLPLLFQPLKTPQKHSSPPKDGVSASPRTQILTGDRHSHREVFPLLSADSLLLHLFLSSSATSSQHCHHSYPDFSFLLNIFLKVFKKINENSNKNLKLGQTRFDWKQC